MKAKYISSVILAVSQTHTYYQIIMKGLVTAANVKNSTFIFCSREWQSKNVTVALTHSEAAVFRKRHHHRMTTGQLYVQMKFKSCHQYPVTLHLDQNSSAPASACQRWPFLFIFWVYNHKSLSKTISVSYTSTNASAQHVHTAYLQKFRATLVPYNKMACWINILCFHFQPLETDVLQQRASKGCTTLFSPLFSFACFI